MAALGGVSSLPEANVVTTLALPVAHESIATAPYAQMNVTLGAPIASSVDEGGMAHVSLSKPVPVGQTESPLRLAAPQDNLPSLHR